MTDMVKGILIGIVAVKIIESDTVQNYIHKVIRKKCHDFGTKVADAIFPVDDEKDEDEDEDHIDISKRVKPKSDDYVTLFDEVGRAYKFRRAPK